MERGWTRLPYDGAAAREAEIPAPPAVPSNHVGAAPQYKLFDFRLPELSQQFNIPPDSDLIIEFFLIIKGMKSSDFLSLFLNLDPGCAIYVGNIKGDKSVFSM